MRQFVLVELYTDGTDAASDTNQKSAGIAVQDRGDSVLRDLRCRPAVVVAQFAGLTRNAADFFAFLRTP